MNIDQVFFVLAIFMVGFVVGAVVSDAIPPLPGSPGQKLRAWGVRRRVARRARRIKRLGMQIRQLEMAALADRDKEQP